MSRLSKLLVLVFGVLLIVLGFLPSELGVAQSSSGWVINGTSVYLDDANVYLCANPHTLQGSGWVEFELRTKQWGGYIDVVWGLPSGSGVIPSKPQRWALNVEHANQRWVTVERQYSQRFDNIASWQNIGWGSGEEPDLGNHNNTFLVKLQLSGGGNTTPFNVAFNNYTQHSPTSATFRGNYDNNEAEIYYTYYDDWVSWNSPPIQTVYYSYAGVDEWKVVQLDIPVQIGQVYKVRCWLDVPFTGLEHNVIKYVWGGKPQAETIAQARASGHLYILDPWLSGGWGHRVLVWTDQGDVDADLTNYPLLLYLSTASGINDDDVSFVFDNLTSNDNRKKIAVTTSDGTTECSVEIENWNHTTEKAWLWVKAPSVSGSTNTSFYLYYDSTHTNNTNVGDIASAAGQAVWSSGSYRAVYHQNWASGTLTDSTSLGLNATNARAPTAISGLTDGAVDYSTDYFGPKNIYASNPSAFTWEIWVKPDVVNSDDGMVGTQYGGIPQYAIYNSKWYIGTTVGGTSYGDYDQPMYVGQWQYVAWTYTDSDDVMRYYYNGTQVDSDTTIGGTAYMNINLYIGTYDYTTGLDFDGIEDELRFSTASKSAAEIKANYEAVSKDHLVDWGTEEIACSPDISIDVSSWSVNSGSPVSAGSNYATGLTWCTITNNSGGTIDITIHGTDMSGGGYTWDLSDTGTPSSMTYGMYAGLAGGDYTIVVKETGSTPYNYLKQGLAASGTQDFGMKIYVPTSFTNEGNQKSGTMTLTAACS